MGSALRAGRVAVTVLFLGGCLFEPMPDCRYTTCGTQDGTVTAVAPGGSVRWSTTLRDSADVSSPGEPRSAPVVHARGSHVVVDGCRAVHVIDAASGRVLLETVAMDRVWAVTDDLVVGSFSDAASGGTGPDARGLLALPLTDADASWVRLDNRHDMALGVVEVGASLAVLVADAVHVLRPDEPATVVPLDDPVSPSPGRPPALVGVDDSTVAVLHDDGTVEAVDTTSGRPVWTIGSSRPARTARAGRLGDDLVLSWGASTRGEVARVTAGGTVRWRAEGALPNRVVLAPAAPVVPVAGYPLTGVDAASGERLSLASHPRPAHDVAVLATPDAVAWTASGIGTTSAWPVRKPAGDPVWSHQGVLVGQAHEAAMVLLTGRSSVHALTAVDRRGADLWQVEVRHSWPTVDAVPGVGTVVSDLGMEKVRARDCDDYPARHTVPAESLDG